MYLIKKFIDRIIINFKYNYNIKYLNIYYILQFLYL